MNILPIERGERQVHFTIDGFRYVLTINDEDIGILILQICLRYIKYIEYISIDILEKNIDGFKIDQTHRNIREIS